MKAAATTRRTKDWVKVKELGPASTHRKKHGFRWLVESRLSGKRSRRYFHTGDADKRDAFAREMESKIDSLSKEARDILTDPKLLEETSRAMKHLASHGASITAAVEHYIKHLEEIAERDSTPVEVVVSDFLGMKEKEGVSPDHYADLRIRLSRFERDFGEKPIAGIKRKEVKAWLMGLPVELQTKVNFRNVLSNLFAHACDKEHIPSNTAAGIKLGKLRRKKIEIITSEEAETLLAHCTEETLPATILMLFCGIRVGEVARLDWRDIDWEDSTIEVDEENAKCAGHGRFVDIPANAIEWLIPLKKLRGAIVPFNKRDGFAKAMREIRALAGWKPGEWPKNALRKTYISCHYGTHESADKTAKQAGTSTTMIHKHYKKPMKKSKAERLWGILPNQQADVIPISQAI
jgi:integrase